MRAHAALAAAVLLGAGCHDGAAPARERGEKPSAAALAAAAPLGTGIAVPRLRGRILLDGQLEEDDWREAARSSPFVDTAGVEARPFSEARFLCDDEDLYVGLYAADDDIHAEVTEHDGPVASDDAFSLAIVPEAPGAPSYVIDVSARGFVADARWPPGGARDARWEGGSRIATEHDGTINDASDEDEEWEIEAAIPLKSLGLAPGARFSLGLSRCDTPRAGGDRRCGAFHAGLTLAPPR